MSSRYNTPVIDRRKVLILTALHMEAAAIARAFGRTLPRGGGPVRLADSPVPAELHIIGIGAARMHRDLLWEEAGGIIVAGIGGALDPSLGPGDVVMDSESPGALARLCLRLGRIHTSDHMVGTVEEKAALYRGTGAAAVDMETARVREALGGRGVPVLGVRAISDTAEEALDPALLGFTDSAGRARPISLAIALVRRPGLVVELMRMRARARLAVGNLARAIRSIVAVMAEGSIEGVEGERLGS